MSGSRPASSLKRSIAGHPVAAFLLILYPLSWILFLPSVLGKSGLGVSWGPLLASVAVAPLFGFVHFPLFLVAGGLTEGRPQGIHVLEFAFYLLVLFSVPVRIIITWVFNSTGGSLPVVALLHASVDTTASDAILKTFYPGVDGRLLYVAIAIVAGALVVITRGRLGYREVAVPTQSPLTPEIAPT